MYLTLGQTEDTPKKKKLVINSVLLNNNALQEMLLILLQLNKQMLRKKHMTKLSKLWVNMKRFLKG